MITSDADYVPIRVNIRFLAKEKNYETDVAAGRIAPPPTPLLSGSCCFNVGDQNKKFIKNENASSAVTTQSQHSKSPNSPIYQLFPKTESCDSEKQEKTRIQVFIDHQNETDLNKLQQPSCNLLKRHHVPKRRRIKRTGVVVTPFSERRNENDDDEINATCQLMPLQTTGGYFKGKPPITFSSRLGFFRTQITQNPRFHSAPSSESLAKFPRCYSADVPSSTKTCNFARRQLPIFPRPKTTFANLTTQTQTAKATSCSENVIRNFNSETDNNLPPTINSAPKKKKTTCEIKQNYIPSIFQLSNAKRNLIATVNKESLIVDMGQMTTATRRKIAVTQISPFRRNLKINS